MIAVVVVSVPGSGGSVKTIIIHAVNACGGVGGGWGNISLTVPVQSQAAANKVRHTRGQKLRRGQYSPGQVARY